MRSAGNFSPEWGYLAPAPTFARTARVVLVATAIGATAGAGVVFALIERPAEPEKTPLAARAIVTSVRATAVPSVTPAASTGSAAPIPAPAVASAAVSAKKSEPPRQETRQAAAVAMPPIPPSSPALPPIAVQVPVSPTAPAAPVVRARSIAAHAPGSAASSPATTLLRARPGAANAVAAAPIAAPRAKGSSTATANAASPALIQSTTAVSTGSMATPPATPPLPSAESNIATGSAGTATPAAGEGPAVAPTAPIDASGNPNIIGPEAPPPKKSKHSGSGKNSHAPGIGTMLRRFFVAHSGRTYYPNRGGLSN